MVTEERVSLKWVTDAVLLAAVTFFVTCTGIVRSVGYAMYFDVPLELVPTTGMRIFSGFVEFLAVDIGVSATALLLWHSVGTWLARFAWWPVVSRILLVVIAGLEVLLGFVIGMPFLLTLTAFLSASLIFAYIAAVAVQVWLLLPILVQPSRPAQPRDIPVVSFKRHNNQIAMAFAFVGWFALAYCTGWLHAMDQSEFYVAVGADQFAVALFSEQRAVCFRWRKRADGARQVERGLKFVPLDQSAVFERRTLGQMTRADR